MRAAHSSGIDKGQTIIPHRDRSTDLFNSTFVTIDLENTIKKSEVFPVVHVWTEHIRNHNPAIRFLEILKNCTHDARSCYCS